MQPFNDTFSALHPVISCSRSPKELALKGYSTDASCQWHFHLWVLPFASEELLTLYALLVLPFTGRKSVFLAGFTFLPLDKAYCFLPFFFPSIVSKVCWTIPVEAAKKLKVPKSVEMPKESMRKSVFVESLKHSVIPPTNIDRTLGRKTLIWRIPGRHKKWHVRNIYEWGQGDFEEATMHPTKKESEDKLTLQEGPIKITPVKIYGRQWWLNEKESCTWLTLIIERSPLKILSWLIWVLLLHHLSVWRNCKPRIMIS